MRWVRRFLILSGLALTLAVLGAVSIWWWLGRPINWQGEPIRDFNLPSGQGARQTMQTIANSGVPIQPELLSWYARLTGQARNIKAGSYELANGVSQLEVLKKITRGDVTQRDLTVLEGWTAQQFISALRRHPDLLDDLSGLTEAALAERLGLPTGMALEGWFFPDTYLFSRGSTASEVLRRAYRMQQQRLERAWQKRQDNLPLSSPYQALILASIIEKETGRAADRRLVASVFINRLRQGMLLQTDPTVIYGLGANFDGNLRKRDLQTDTPYNTYTRGGLPPTPIALPGEAALEAALNPASSRALYFVARGDGSSEFSETLEAHNRAVNKYQRGK